MRGRTSPYRGGQARTPELLGELREWRLDFFFGHLAAQDHVDQFIKAEEADVREPEAGIPVLRLFIAAIAGSRG